MERKCELPMHNFTRLHLFDFLFPSFGTFCTENLQNRWRQAFILAGSMRFRITFWISIFIHNEHCLSVERTQSRQSRLVVPERNTTLLSANVKHKVFHRFCINLFLKGVQLYRNPKPERIYALSIIFCVRQR